MWKNSVEWGRPQMTIWCMCALHAGYLRLHIQTLTICNTYCFTTTTSCFPHVFYFYNVYYLKMTTLDEHI